MKSNHNSTWQNWFPWLKWRNSYHKQDLLSDIVAGIVVAVLLVPQGMAYAMLAGLPPQLGLYAAILPTLLYSLFGSSRSLAVGPVAIASLMTGEAVLAFAQSGSSLYLQLTIQLSLLTALFLLLLRILRLGKVVAFMSHPVISGFTAGAAILIALNQLKHLFGFNQPNSHGALELIQGFLQQISHLNLATSALSAIALLLLWSWKSYFSQCLQMIGTPRALADNLAKAAPMIAVIFGLLASTYLQLPQQFNVAVVGSIPSGLPQLSISNLLHSSWQSWFDLAPSAFLIALIGFLESVSVATALAGKQRETIEPDNELLALGMANLGAAVSGTMPVAGGFGRSMVNFSAGARTTLASVIAALLMVVTLLWFASWFETLPRAILGVIILMAVLPLIDIKIILQTWRYNKADGVTLFACMGGVLLLGVELGILLGVACSFVLLVWRVSQPHIAQVGRVDNKGHYRNLKRYPQAEDHGLLLIRVDESLYFANARIVEETLGSIALEQPGYRHMILICSGINFIDASALESLERLLLQLKSSDIQLHLAEVKGPVMDRLAGTHFMDYLGHHRVFLSTEQAVEQLSNQPLEWMI